MPINQSLALRLILILTALTSCKDKTSPILEGKNFDEGKWLLVVENNVENTLFVIDDENILKSNPYGLRLGLNADCGGTTCDGFIELYKDGELVASQEFLSRSDLKETEDIRKAYKMAKTNCIEPNESEFKQRWDSLRCIKNIYPTRRHVLPADKDIICFYSY